MKREAWPPEWEQDPPKCVVCGEQHWPSEKHATAVRDKRDSVNHDDPMDKALDDAIHIAWPEWPGRSLCGYSERMNLVAYDAPLPDRMAGCWTCIAERKARAR